MTIVAEWKLSEAYFHRYWADWMRSVSKLRRWTVPLAGHLGHWCR